MTTHSRALAAYICDHCAHADKSCDESPCCACVGANMWENPDIKAPGNPVVPNPSDNQLSDKKETP